MSNLPLIVEFHVQPGQGEKFGERIRQVLEPTRNEAANLAYELLQSATDPDRWFLYEVWVSQDGLDAHFAMPYMKELLPDIEPLLAEPFAMNFLSNRSSV